MKNQRYLALDVLRGITIAGMILVNTPGSWTYIYAPLRHSSWHGCTPTDLVFPFFLFVMGVSICFSFAKFDQGLNKKVLSKIAKRSALIFSIGLFLNSFPQWQTDYSNLRIMGVMQRIAIVYAISAILVLQLKKKSLVIVSLSLLFVHWIALYFLGGNDPYALEENACILVDRFILGESHMYHGYGVAFDPEGILSSLSALVTVLIGYGVGILIKEMERQKMLPALLVSGGMLVVTGLIWGLVLPINKPLWTGSYVLYTAGLAMLLLGMLIWLIDFKGYKKWASFFVVFGMNPLVIYALSCLWVRILMKLIPVSVITETVPRASNAYVALYESVFIPLAGPLNGSLFFALSHVVFFWFIAWVLYRKNIFIKV